MAEQRNYSFYGFDFRQHHRETYGNKRPYGDYEFAYQFGYQLAHDSRYQGFSWKEIERDVQRNWAQHYPDFDWDDYHEAVYEGWRTIEALRR